MNEARHHAYEFVGFGTVTGAVGEVGIAFAWSTARGSLEPVGVPIMGSGRREVALSVTSSHPDISTAAPSFITAPGTIEGTTDSSGQMVSNWGAISPSAKM